MKSNELNEHELAVLDAVRQHYALRGEPIGAMGVREAVLRTTSYDQAQRALTSLVEKGFLVKPSRGVYEPIEELKRGGL